MSGGQQDRGLAARASEQQALSGAMITRKRPPADCHPLLSESECS